MDYEFEVVYLIDRNGTTFKILIAILIVLSALVACDIVRSTRIVLARRRYRRTTWVAEREAREAAERRLEDSRAAHRRASASALPDEPTYLR